MLLVCAIRNAYDYGMPQTGHPDGESAPRTTAFNVHLQQLAYLREVERAGSMTRAAEALHVSQSALSQALAELERRLGVVLFEKAGRHRTLTPEGREALAFARSVLNQAEELRSSLDASRGGETGRLRVGMIDAASLYVLPGTVRRYRQARPAVALTLEVDSSEALVERLRDFELDLAFVVGPPDDDLWAVEVRREPLFLYAPAADHRGPAVAEWALYPVGSRTRRIIDAGLARLGIRPNVTLESGNPEVLRQMVAIGLGWSVLPPSVADGGAAGDALRRGEWVAERTLFAVRRHSGREDPRAAAFLRLALES